MVVQVVLALRRSPRIVFCRRQIVRRQCAHSHQLPWFTPCVASVSVSSFWCYDFINFWFLFSMKIFCLCLCLLCVYLRATASNSKTGKPTNVFYCFLFSIWFWYNCLNTTNILMIWLRICRWGVLSINIKLSNKLEFTSTEHTKN